MPSFLSLAESQLQLIARVIVILPSSVSRAAWSSDGTAMISPRCPGWSHAPCGALDDGAHETVNDWQIYSGGRLNVRVARRNTKDALTERRMGCTSLAVPHHHYRMPCCVQNTKIGDQRLSWVMSAVSAMSAARPLYHQYSP